jgi:selenocysteine lyase/cysteine desulfurase
VGCLPRGAAQALGESFFQPWAQAGDAWPQWLQAIEAFKSGLARLLGGRAEDFSPQVNLSSALSKLLPALRAQSSRSILLTHANAFPSMGFVLERATGFERQLFSGAAADAEAWYEALNETIAAVVITHVHSNSGVIEPVRAITERCRTLGITSIVDVAQSAGIIPIALDELGADLVIGSCVKWLCGGPGAGFMWVRPELLVTLAPADVGWFSHDNPFELDIAHFQYAADARRFWGGTPSIAPYVLATHALELIDRIGVAAIRLHNRKLKQAFIAQTPGPSVRSEAETGGTVCLQLNQRAETVAAALRTAGHFFDKRGQTLRLSFHIYNEESEARDLGRLCAAAMT